MCSLFKYILSHALFNCYNLMDKSNTVLLHFRCIVSLALVTFVLALPCVIYLSDLAAHKRESGSQPRWMDAWVFQLLLNLAGYASVLVPGYLIIQVVQRTGYLQRAGDRRFLAQEFVKWNFGLLRSSIKYHSLIWIFGIRQLSKMNFKYKLLNISSGMLW